MKSLLNNSVRGFLFICILIHSIASFGQKYTINTPFETLEKAAEKKRDKNAQYALAYCYDVGKGVVANHEKAWYWYLKAALQGHVAAQNNLAFCYNNGNGVSKDKEKAIYWYRKASENGSSSASFNLGLLLISNGTEADWYEAFMLLNKHTDKPLAQGIIGECYYFGRGTNKDYNQALEWFERAASNQITGIEIFIGNIYYYGQGRNTNYEEAFNWYEKGVEKGCFSCFFGLGNCYYYGHGVEKDYNKALYYFKKSCDLSPENKESFYYVGKCYYFGEGVEKNYTEAIKWLYKSVEGDYSSSEGMNLLSRCYRFGRGVQTDINKADYWFNKSQTSKSCLDNEMELAYQRIKNQYGWN